MERSDLWLVVLVACLVGPLAAGCSPAPEPEPETVTEVLLEGPYLGQEPPGAEAELFAPGIVSTGMAERDVAMTPDGAVLYFTRSVGPRMTVAAIMVVRRDEEGRWGEPEVAPFSGRYFDLEPAVAPDGGRLLFVSTRPLPGEQAPSETEQIWVMDRVGDGWGPPRPAGPPVNGPAAQFFPSLTADGTDRKSVV